MLTKLKLVVVVVMTSATVLTACGGDGDDDAAATSSVTAPASVAAETERSATEPAVADQAGTRPAATESGGAVDPAATRVEVDATAFHFELEPPTTAGRYSFVMTNNGHEPHLMILAQLQPGATLDDVMASEGEEGLVQAFESLPSGPGGESSVTADLTAGQWILVCPIPSAANDMQPHVALGMIHELDIT